MKRKVPGRYLKHYGMPRRSGRYPWGSGKQPQRNKNIYNVYRQLRNEGFTDKEIAEQWDMSQSKLKKLKAAGLMEQKELNMQRALALKAKGYGATEIGRRMGVRESTVRGWFKEDKMQKIAEAKVTAETIKEFVDKNKYVDIGKGTEIALGVTRARMDVAVEYLKSKGYEEHTIYMDQMGTNYQTTYKCLIPPGVTYSELREHRHDIVPVTDTIINPDGIKLAKSEPPTNIDVKRVAVKYAEDGGTDMDGVIQIRRGCEDLNLGRAMYAQVRIGVNGTHYAKGMCVYGDDSIFPPGCDILINSNKKKGTPVLGKGDDTVLKEQKKDKDNPFGTSIKDSDQLEMVQKYYTDSKTGQQKLSALNIVNEEGNWAKWTKSLSSQFLSKQRTELAKAQLNQKYTEKMDEFNDICNLTNPTVKRILLAKFADSCDGAAQDLKAAALPNQTSAVILPGTTLKENEVYAPHYENGTRVVLIRHPHASTSEIPQLVVNNNNKECQKMLGKHPTDAVCIHPKAAQQMSGADFDGDSVLVIPANNPGGKVKIKTQKQFDDLVGFDTGKYKYTAADRESGKAKIMTDKQKGKEMGKVSNLITDMTLQHAPEEDMVRAIKHSMVVIDAKKHELDWKRSERENNIKELVHRYQKSYNPETGEVHYGGASTIISRSKSKIDIPEVRAITNISKYYVDEEGKEHGNTNPETGEIVRIKTDKSFTYINSKSQVPRLYKDRKTGKMYTLDPDTKERTYRSDSEVKAIQEAKNKKNVKMTVYTDKKTGKMYTIDPDTKQRVYRTLDEVAEEGRVQGRTTSTTRMAVAKDAYELTSGGSKEDPGHPMEAVYADYANNMKALANRTRLEYLKTPPLKQDKEARQKYQKEYEELQRALLLAKSNAPKERRAQALANKEVDLWKENNPGFTQDDLKKVKGKAIAKARPIVGAKKEKVDFTDRQWEAIQKGAISDSMLEELLNNADIDKVRQRAMPRQTTSLPPTKVAVIKAMAKTYTQAEIAKICNLSASQVSKAINSKD